MRCLSPIYCAATLLLILLQPEVIAEPTVIRLWPDLAPGETTSEEGVLLARRANEDPPATRISKITAPSLEAYLAPQNHNRGTAIIACPGGGLNYVVSDKEGSEAAAWLNSMGVSLYVLKYRTKNGSSFEGLRPLQDVQRAIRWLRANAPQQGLNKERIGVMGFSAGGLVGALAASSGKAPAYPSADGIDKESCRPDFALLLYPGLLLDSKKETLIPQLKIDEMTAPTFIATAHNDPITPLNSLELYRALNRAGVSAELHVYVDGGHGYGMRQVEGSYVHTWRDRATDWLAKHELILSVQGPTPGR